MNETKYIGLDVHQATISAALLDSTGELLMESILETKAATILQFVHGLRGSLHVTICWFRSAMRNRRTPSTWILSVSSVRRRSWVTTIRTEIDPACAGAELATS
jgi:hypothetical protein